MCTMMPNMCQRVSTPLMFTYFNTLFSSCTEVPPPKSSKEFLRFPEHNEDTILRGGGYTMPHTEHQLVPGDKRPVRTLQLAAGTVTISEDNNCTGTKNVILAYHFTNVWLSIVYSVLAGVPRSVPYIFFKTYQTRSCQPGSLPHPITFI